MNSSAHRAILHVEDDPNDVLLVQRAFRKADASVVIGVVNDGEAALEYLSGRGAYSDRRRYPFPELVLLDLKIPRKSGLEVLAWVRGLPELKRLPVAVLTSSKHERDVNLAYEKGANSYLVKPVGFEALLETVKMIRFYWLELNQMPAISGFEI